MAASSSFTTLQAARALWFSSRLHGVEVVGRSGMPRAMACFGRPRWRQVDRVGVAGNVLRHVSTLTCPEDQRKYVGGQGCGSRLFLAESANQYKKVPRESQSQVSQKETGTSLAGVRGIECYARHGTCRKSPAFHDSASIKVAEDLA